MACLEIGCGTGLILAYLAAKGVENLRGIDHDPELEAVVPAQVRDHFQVADVWSFLAENRSDAGTYDRILLFDVLEHFDAEEGCRLLRELAGALKPGGRIHLKVPNAGSPWGIQFQYGDLTHKTAYTPESLRQQAVAAGLRCLEIYPQKLGSPARQFWEGLVHGLLDRLLASPPEIWQGNFYAVLETADPGK